MEILGTIIQTIINMGAGVFLPIILTIVGLVFGMNFWKALKSGLLVGIGYTCLNLIVNLLISTIAPVTSFFASSGEGYAIIDAGWSTLAGAAWATPFAAIIIPACLIINIILIKVHFTKTLNVDIWDYWHFMFTGAMAYYLLISNGVSIITAYIVGLVITLTLSVIALYLGDKMGIAWRDFFGLEGTSAPHQAAQTTWLVASLINKIIDIIPGLNKIHLTMDTFTKKFSLVGDSTILGFIIGCLLALFTGQDITTILTTGVGIASSMVVMPKMVSLLLEGITPIGKAAVSSLKKRMGEDVEIEMGMDVALGLGDPTTITAGVIMIPITVIIALIYPNNNFFPIGSLPALVYTTVMCSLATRGDLFRTLICATVYMFYFMFAMNFLAIPATAVVAASGTYDLAGNMIVGTALDALPNLIVGIVAKILGLF